MFFYAVFDNDSLLVSQTHISPNKLLLTDVMKVFTKTSYIPSTAFHYQFAKMVSMEQVSPDRLNRPNEILFGAGPRLLRIIGASDLPQ